MKQKRTKPKPTPPKRESSYLDELETAETADWVADCERREYKESPEYQIRKKLADKFARKKK